MSTEKSRNKAHKEKEWPQKGTKGTRRKNQRNLWIGFLLLRAFAELARQLTGTLNALVHRWIASVRD